MLSKEILHNIENKIVVSEKPFPHTILNNFLPEEIVKNAEKEFGDIKKKAIENKTYSGHNLRAGFEIVSDGGYTAFQKTKRVLYDYSKMPPTTKNIIDFLYSDGFLKILERKFKLNNIQADWKLFGGGLHESFRGGFLKVHSDFLYMRKSKLRRVLNLLLYLNSDWQESWGGSIELWDKNMNSCSKSLLPALNNAVIFRTDTDSNHGFPEPMLCPENISRKSLALYYYVSEKTILPVAVRRRKLFHAVWKRRPNTKEMRFADNDPFFKRLKHRFFYRFF